MKKLIAAIVAASTFFANASAASVGINTHWGHSNYAAPYIEYANDVNAKWVRDGLNWNQIEAEENVYEILNPQHGNMPKELKKSDLGMVFILGFGNCLYDGCITMSSHKKIPYQGAYLEAWKNYVRFIATTYKGLVDVYEVWNEPDIGNFNANNVSGSYYVKLLKATKEILNEVDPNAKVAGAVVTNEGSFKHGKTTHSYLEDILKAGGGEYMDIVSVHIYTQKFTLKGGGDGECNYTDDQKTPEIAYRDWLEYFENSLDKYNITKDVWLTEAGWFTGDSTYAVPEEVQAKYLIRQAVLWEDYLKTNNRKGEMIFYQAKDSNNDGGTLFGLQDAGGRKKPGYYSLKAYNTLLKYMSFTGLLEDKINNTYVATYNSDTRITIRYMWDGTQTVQAVSRLV